MGTAFLVLKSLFPFIREIVLKDKTLRSILFGNLLATFLIGALIFMFCLLMYISSVASTALESIRGFERETETLTERLEEKDEQVMELSKENGELHARLKTWSTGVPRTSPDSTAPPKVAPPHKPQPKPPVIPKGSAKSDTQSKLKQLE